MDLIAGSVALAVAAIGAGVDMVNMKHIKQLQEQQEAQNREMKVYGFCIAATGIVTIFERYRMSQELKSAKLDFRNEISVMNDRINQLDTRTDQVANGIASIRSAMNLENVLK